MADIKQAAKWMKDGCRVRRPSWVQGTYYLANPYKINLFYAEDEVPSKDIELFYHDLLAEDWEISE